MGDLQTIIRDLKSHATKEKAAFLPYFFKTGKCLTHPFMKRE